MLYRLQILFEEELEEVLLPLQPCSVHWPFSTLSRLLRRFAVHGGLPWLQLVFAGGGRRALVFGIILRLGLLEEGLDVEDVLVDQLREEPNVVLVEGELDLTDADIKRKMESIQLGVDD